MNDRPLKGKVAVVTGSYRNLGSVTAETLAQYGADVIVNDRPVKELAEDGEKLVQRIKDQGVRGLAIAADLSKSSAIHTLCAQAVETFGKVDILVNNAGPFNMDPYTQLSEEMWDIVMDVNLKATYLMTKELAPQMKSNGWGRIINMSAGSSFVRNHNVYTLAKVGVSTMTESLAIELGPEITVNAIAPGQIFESLPDIAEFDPTFGERYTKRAPSGRLVTRREIASIIATLCTSTFDGMTGMTLRVDGGAEIPKF